MALKQSEEREKNWGAIAAGWGLAVLIVFVVLSAVQYWLVFDSETKAEWFSASGDFFGFANAVFSALAFAMIIVTLWMQKNELELQRQEIRDNRHVLESQKNEMAQQNTSLAQSNFEGILFSLLSRQHEILLGVRATYFQRGDVKELRGSLAFESFSRGIGEIITKQKQIRTSENPLDGWFNRYSIELGRYFLNLIILFEMIAKQPEERQPFYSDILKAQLSYGEMDVLFWFGLFSAHGHRVKPYLENLAFFKDVPLSEETADFRSLYYPSAFGVESSWE